MEPCHLEESWSLALDVQKPAGSVRLLLHVESIKNRACSREAVLNANIFHHTSQGSRPLPQPASQLQCQGLIMIPRACGHVDSCLRATPKAAICLNVRMFSPGLLQRRRSDRAVQAHAVRTSASRVRERTLVLPFVLGDLKGPPVVLLNTTHQVSRGTITSQLLSHRRWHTHVDADLLRDVYSRGCGAAWQPVSMPHRPCWTAP